MINNIIESITMLIWNLKEGYGFNMSFVDGDGLTNLVRYVQFRSDFREALLVLLLAVLVMIAMYLVTKVFSKD